MADFTGFYFDNIHSSTYHLLRVSDGERFSEGLSPEFEDRTIELIGGVGSLYQGTRFKETEFKINIAFDNITEQDFRDLRTWLEPNKLKELRFDERPYKAYWAKLKNRPVFDYVCFMEDNPYALNREKRRIYKGEAELTFIAYDPFGYCNDNSMIMTDEGLKPVEYGVNWQILDSYGPFVIADDNATEWGAESGLKNAINFVGYNEFAGLSGEYTANLYNPGDFEADFELFIDLSKTSSDLTGKLITVSIQEINSENPLFFQFSVNGLNSTDRILLNTKKHTLSIFKEGAIRKDLRYDLIKSTDWIKIPKGECVMQITCGLDNLAPQIKYNYKYY